MTTLTLAKWLHDNYEAIATQKNWQTQAITRVPFDQLPEENKQTMLGLADKLLKTFKIEKRPVYAIGSNNCPYCKSENTKLYSHNLWDCLDCKRCFTIKN